MQLAAREAAAEAIWAPNVLEPANSLINYEIYSKEGGDQAGSNPPQWQAQGSTTETHPELVM